MFLRSLSLSFSLLLIACAAKIDSVVELPVPVEPKLISMEILTSKDVYKSKELLEMQIHVLSELDTNNLQLAIWGLEKNGKPMVYTVTAINLTMGENEIRSGYQLPSCNTCSGLREGNYSLHADLYYGTELLMESNTTIKLEQ